MRWNVGRQRSGEPADEGLVELLAGAPAFAGCTHGELRQIAALGTEVRRRPDTVLVRAGAPLRQGLVILEGVVSEQPAAGRERAVSVGHLVGAEGLEGAHVVSATTAVALTEVRLLVFGPLEMADVAELADVRGSRRRSARPAAAPAWRPLVEPAWGSAAPAPA